MDIVTDMIFNTTLMVLGIVSGKGESNIEYSLKYVTVTKYCGHGLVVKYILAKDESGVRFSLPAHKTQGLDAKRSGFCVLI